MSATAQLSSPTTSTTLCQAPHCIGVMMDLLTSLPQDLKVEQMQSTAIRAVKTASSLSFANLAFGQDFSELDLEATKAFYGRSFTLLTKTRAQEELLTKAGFAFCRTQTAMDIQRPTEKRESRTLPEGVKLHVVRSEEDLADWQGLKAKIYKRPLEEVSKVFSQEILSDKNSLLLLGTWKDKPVGHIFVCFGKDRGSAFWLGVDEAARKHGVGTALAAASVDAVFDAGCETFSFEASDMSQKIWTRLGGQETDPTYVWRYNA